MANIHVYGEWIPANCFVVHTYGIAHGTLRPTCWPSSERRCSEGEQAAPRIGNSQ